MSYEEIDWESFGELETPEAKIKRSFFGTGGRKKVHKR